MSCVASGKKVYLGTRFGQPEDVARVATFLASDDAGWLTGEIIFANGGSK
jgi:3-oxoacyl-[acyl-carrier protein] reductase